MKRSPLRVQCECGHPRVTHGPARCLVVECRCTQITAVKKARNKYGAQTCVGPLGEIYASKAERDYAAVLEDRRQWGAVERWTWAPRFVLQDEPLISVRWDFLVWPRGAGVALYAVDVKGSPSRDWSLRVRLWQSRYPNVPLVVVRNGIEEWLE